MTPPASIIGKGVAVDLIERDMRMADEIEPMAWQWCCPVSLTVFETHKYIDVDENSCRWCAH
jgi:hypothetical protein